MRVHLIKEKTIRSFVLQHARSRRSFEEWLYKLRMVEWLAPSDIKATFNSADLLGRRSNRVVFDVAGNNYRMICKYVFGKEEIHLFVCWIGTHADYDKLCKNNGQYTINIY